MAPWGKLPFTQDWVFAIKTWWNMHISGLSGKSWKHPWNKWTLFMWAMSLTVSWASVESALCLQRSLNFQQFLSNAATMGIPFLGKDLKKHPSKNSMQVSTNTSGTGNKELFPCYRPKRPRVGYRLTHTSVKREWTCWERTKGHSALFERVKEKIIWHEK